MLKVIKLVGKVFVLVPKKVIVRAMHYMENIAPSGNFVVNLYGAYAKKEVTRREIFENRKLYTFEGEKFWGVNDADSYLTQIYGDYMELPPKSKRVSGHIGKVKFKKNM